MTERATQRDAAVLAAALAERTKEIACLHALGRIVEEEGTSVDGLLQRVVAMLPAAWQHADDARVRIVLRGREFASSSFAENRRMLVSPLVVNGVEAGSVAVAYGRRHRAADEGPFLKEERALLDTVAERLGHVVERLEDAAALQQERAQMLALFDGIDDVIYVAEPHTHEMLWMNAAARRLWGEDFAGRKCHEVLQGRSEPCPFCTNDKIFGPDAGSSYVWEFRNEVTGRWFRCSDKAIRWSDGRMVRFELAADITASKVAAEKLVRSEREFRLLAETAQDMIYRMAIPSGKYEYVSPAAESLFGYAPQEFYEEPAVIRRIVHPDWHEYFDREWQALLKGEAPPNYEYQIVHRNGETRWMNQRNALILDDAGASVAIQGIVTDVTSAKRAATELAALAEELRRANAELDQRVAARTSELQTIIDGIPGLVFYKDAENRYIRVNRYVANAHKVPKSELEGRNCYDLYPLEQAKAYHEDDLAVIRSGRPRLNIDEPWETESGRRWLSTSKIPFLGEDGSVVGVIGVSMDVTERRQAEDEIRAKAAQLERQNWIREGQNRLSGQMRGGKSPGRLANDIVGCLARHVGAVVGAMYLREGDRLRLTGRYAYRKHADVPDEFAFGEGLVGQVAAEGRTMQLDGVPADYVVVGSGLGQTRPVAILAFPCLFAETVNAVVELAGMEPFTEAQREFLDRVAEAIGIAVETARARELTRELLEETQKQAEELQAQQEELRTTNEELEEQTRRLRESEERLRAQHEEMEVTNEELKEKNGLLQSQKQEVEAARREVERKAEELALASKYKSEFLSNMSHELRTPLNSLLILAQDLAQNCGGNLTEDQLESARVIHGSGSDLLNLINEILDLSRIEAGRMDVRIDAVPLASVAASLRASFQRMAEDKGLEFAVTLRDGIPEEIRTDRQRLEQILRNLVANAIKFTEEGRVDVTIGRGGRGIAFSVADTGIGVPLAQQKAIFEAFQQGDGSTSRKYGGTGLGLSISRELARLLEGEISLASESGKGSVFVLSLPLLPASSPDGVCTAPSVGEAPPPTPPPPVPARVADDRDSLEPDESPVLVVEDDAKFAKVLADTCRRRGFKILVATSGEEGLALARKHIPAGILLDIQLPGMDGWTMLDALKEDTRTRHVPVHVVSVEESVTESLRRGAIGHATKPITREALEAVFGRLQDAAAPGPRRILLVDDDTAVVGQVRQLLAGPDVELDEAGSAALAMEALRRQEYACIILDLQLPDMSGAELLRCLTSEGTAIPPVIVHTARDLSEEQEAELREYADSIVIKDVRSQERLLDEVSLFLHRMVSAMPEAKRQIIRDLHETDALLKDRKILVVDDDMRTTFALARLLSQRGARPVKAANGEQALAALEREPDIDIVLMDVMMPVMDGYATMGRIRQIERFRKLPIIALTAKAMPNDRRKCIDAGASDYLAKPVDQDRLLSLLRVWLYR